MSYTTSVKFREADWDVTVDFDGGYESDTNAHVIEWHFTGLSPAEHDSLKMTDDEDQAIYEQLCEASYEHSASAFEDDWR